MNDKITPLQLEEKMSAIVNTRELALHCLQLEENLKQAAQHNEEQRLQIEKLTTEQQQTLPYVELGKREMKQMKKETLSRMHAIVLSTGEHQRLVDLQELLEDDNLSVKDVARWHKAITTEFRALYPTHALSQPTQEFKDDRSKTDFHHYQLAEHLDE